MAEQKFEGKHSEITEKILKAFFDVYNALGYGFHEKVYENALQIELALLGLNVIKQKKILVYYKEQVVGEFIADQLVEEKVLLELKSVEKIVAEHEAQLLNYLKSTEIEVGLILNFGPKPEYKRKIFDNERKGSLKWVKPNK